MDTHSYYNILEERLKMNYDIEKNITIDRLSVDLFARLDMKHEKHFGPKSATVWRIENYEYVFVKSFEKLDNKQLENFQEFLKNAIRQFVKPNGDHMSSTITGVMIMDNFPAELEPIIRKFQFRRNFAFSLKGWAEVRLIVVDLHSNRVISNKKAKEVASFYLPVIEKKEKKQNKLLFWRKK